MRPRRVPHRDATAAPQMPDATRVVAASVAVARQQGPPQAEATARVLTAAQLALARCRGLPGRPPTWLAGPTGVAYRERCSCQPEQATADWSAGGA